MITAFELNTLVFQLLNGHVEINGGVYTEDDRPNNSNLEDIVINTIDTTTDALPQIATSNVNIYVPDSTKNINGENQKKANRTRLRKLTHDVIDLLKTSQFVGIKLIVRNQTTISEPNINQHYTNIRIDWNIQTNKI